MGSETEFRTLIEEIDKYSVSTLKNLFGYFKRNPDEAEIYHGNTYELATRVYGLRSVDRESDIVSCNAFKIRNCNNLGNENKDDGYKYIGRGLIQLTGKYNYTQINKEFIKAFPNQVDLIQNPELLEKPKYAAMSGLSYWINNNLNLLADQGFTDDNVDSITKIINKNLDFSHYTRRKFFFKKAKHAFNLNECRNIQSSNFAKNHEDIIIRLVRRWQNFKTTIGIFTVDNTEIKGYILEEKGPSSTASNKELRIPTGEYKTTYHSGNKTKKGIHIWNEQVPFSRYILIHTGNTSDNTEGCLIVGTSKIDENTVSGSRDKFNELYNYIASKNIDKAKLIITENF